MSQIRKQVPKQILPMVTTDLLQSRNEHNFHKVDFLVFIKIKLQYIS